MFEEALATEFPDAAVQKKKKRRAGAGKKRKRLYEACPYCHYCGKKLKLEESTLDHKIPASKGGNGNPENLVVACRRCNNVKADIPYEEFRERMILTPPRGNRRKRRIMLVTREEYQQCKIISTLRVKDIGPDVSNFNTKEMRDENLQCWTGCVERDRE